MATYLITGALRGIGLSLTKELLAKPASEVKMVITTARKRNQVFDDLASKHSGRVAFVQMELNEASTTKAAAEVETIVGSSGLDVLINNAGIMPITPSGVSAMNDLMSVIEVNVQGPHLVTSALLPLLEKSQRKLVIQITSTMGSISMAEGYSLAPTPAYKISKAALNMLNKQYAIDLGKEGFTFVCISPGWLQTDLGSEHADLPVEVGTKAVLERVEKLTQRDNGKSWDIEVKGWTNPSGGPNTYRGEEVAW